MEPVESQQEPDQRSQPEREPTVDQEHLAVVEDETSRQEEDRSQNEQQEQDETLQDQQQQKEAEEGNASEAWNDAAAVVEVKGSGEEEEEDLISLLEPFTKEQLHCIVKQVTKKASNFFYKYYGVNLEEEEDLDLQDDERLEKYLESFTWSDLHEFLISAENDLPTKSLVCQVAGQAADVNPRHLKILVQSHGFRWDATHETLSFLFHKYGEITEIEVCKNITKKITGYAFISFKHWSGASKALKQPLKKIGNRWTVSNLASSGSSRLALRWLESADNSEDWANNVIQEFLKVVDCPILRFSGLKPVGEHLATRQIHRLYHEHENEEYILLWKLHQWLHREPVNRARPPIHITYCDPAAMNYGTSSGCNRDTNILKSGQGGGARPQPAPGAPYKGH